jgi:hypothetical protein
MKLKFPVTEVLAVVNHSVQRNPAQPSLILKLKGDRLALHSGAKGCTAVHTTSTGSGASESAEEVIPLLPELVKQFHIAAKSKPPMQMFISLTQNRLRLGFEDEPVRRRVSRRPRVARRA